MTPQKLKAALCIFAFKSKKIGEYMCMYRGDLQATYYSNPIQYLNLFILKSMTYLRCQIVS